MRDNYVRFVAEAGLTDVMHVQHDVAHVVQRYVRKVTVADVVVAFRQTVANHAGNVAESLLIEVYDVVVEQVLYAYAVPCRAVT